MRSGAFLLLACMLSVPVGWARAEDQDIEAPASANESAKKSAGDEEYVSKTVFASEYPVRFARRPLVLHEGMVRADGRLTIAGVSGSGTFSSFDIGGAVSPIDKLELGLSTELTGAIPAPGGIGLVSVVFSPDASYGDIPVYGRYQFHQGDLFLAAVDLVLVLPSNTDFTLTAGLPMRIVELFGLFTMDMNIEVRYRNGDKYAAFTSNPSSSTADFTFSGASIMNITDNGYVEIGGGVGVTNVGGGPGADNVVELPFFLGGGFTYAGSVLVDLFAQFGWNPLMTANQPTGRDTFNVADDWFVTLGATVHTRPLFGKYTK